MNNVVYIISEMVNTYYTGASVSVIFWVFLSFMSGTVIPARALGYYQQCMQCYVPLHRVFDNVYDVDIINHDPSDLYKPIDCSMSPITSIIFMAACTWFMWVCIVALKH